MGDGKERSVWVYVGCGCGCLVLLVIAAIAALGIFGYRTARSFEADIKDPARRAERVQDMLGYQSPPEGYHPVFSITVPMLFRVAVLTDQPPTAEGQPPLRFERAFFYLRPSGLMKRDDDLGKVFEGAGNPGHAFEKWQSADVRLRGSEKLSAGTVNVAGREIPYEARRGEIEFERQEQEGILAVFVVKCGAGKHDGLGGWLAPDAPDLAGTPADPTALAEFLSQFDLCR